MEGWCTHRSVWVLLVIEVDCGNLVVNGQDARSEGGRRMVWRERKRKREREEEGGGSLPTLIQVEGRQAGRQKASKVRQQWA
ncbi:hypothetical protein B0I35DRAFT_208597 [Stachybotrys elegans]|uniref:Secreted protein n=1 Tax=Stachybotrys elegans TaxID=80388 RepID=A0A8K0SUF7_9HYPO|nr:hypothetical protein B0I35DRAFT_208597 [Stachybotrys elegans]